jgi:hypothetical protein
MRTVRSVGVHPFEWWVCGNGGRHVGSATYSCLQVASMSVYVELTFAGFYPHFLIGVEMIGWEGTRTCFGCQESPGCGAYKFVGYFLMPHCNYMLMPHYILLYWLSILLFWVCIIICSLYWERIIVCLRFIVLYCLCFIVLCLLFIVLCTYYFMFAFYCIVLYYCIVLLYRFCLY